MPLARANGIDLDYDTFGDPGHPALLLIMGFSVQKISWDEEFCQMLADRGFFVIRFDNRDVGLSTKMDDAPRPNIGAAIAGDTSSASYTLDDMAADAAGLLDALNVGAAHIVGASMGGMIAQCLAIREPAKVLSLCSIMSTTGDRSVGQASPEAMSALLQPPPASKEEAVERSVAVGKVIGSPGFAQDEERIRRRAALAWDRGHDPAGVARQLVAIMAAPDRTESLRKVDVPTVVIHGEADPLIDPSGGRATSEAITGARLLVIPGMGHDLPLEVWPQIVDAITENGVSRASPDTPAR
jgi:pimeloyl-ACP methyl ester carboxylesterase